MRSYPLNVQLAIGALAERVKGLPPEAWFALIQLFTMLYQTCTQPVTPEKTQDWLNAKDVPFGLVGFFRNRAKRERKAWFLRETKKLAVKNPTHAHLAGDIAEATYSEVMGTPPQLFAATVASIKRMQ
jgi:hypothetical protein